MHLPCGEKKNSKQICASSAMVKFIGSIMALHIPNFLAKSCQNTQTENLEIWEII